MKLSRPYILKILVVSLLLSLHSSFTWSMEEEDKSAYTHSHTTGLAAHNIKALYIDESALLTVEDREASKIWTYPAIRPEDKRYLRLLKEVSVNYNSSSYGHPNHLMVGIEALFTNQNTQASQWYSWNLSGEQGSIQDFCSTPPNGFYYPRDSYPLNISLVGEEKPQGIFVGSGTLLKKEGERVAPYYFNNSFPILSWIDHRFIQLTNSGYPHSEIEALNALIGINYTALFKPILQGNNILQAFVFKFYSHNDICDSCQSAIQGFIPQFQLWLKREFGKNEKTIPVTAIGMANHCYGFSCYCKKEDKCCQTFPINTILKDTNGGIHTYLKEGIIWKDLDQSHYNTCGFGLLKRGEYKPFSGKIPAFKQEYDPALYIYIKQPNIEDLEKHIKPEFLQYFSRSF